MFIVSKLTWKQCRETTTSPTLCFPFTNESEPVCCDKTEIKSSTDELSKWDEGTSVDMQCFTQKACLTSLLSPGAWVEDSTNQYGMLSGSTFNWLADTHISILHVCVLAAVLTVFILIFEKWLLVALMVVLWDFTHWYSGLLVSVYFCTSLFHSYLVHNLLQDSCVETEGIWICDWWLGFTSFVNGKASWMNCNRGFFFFYCSLPVLSGQVTPSWRALDCSVL